MPSSGIIAAADVRRCRSFCHGCLGHHRRWRFRHGDCRRLCRCFGCCRGPLTRFNRHSDVFFHVSRAGRAGVDGAPDHAEGQSSADDDQEQHEQDMVRGTPHDVLLSVGGQSERPWLTGGGNPGARAFGPRRAGGRGMVLGERGRRPGPSSRIGPTPPGFVSGSTVALLHPWPHCGTMPA